MRSVNAPNYFAMHKTLKKSVITTLKMTLSIKIKAAANSDFVINIFC